MAKDPKYPPERILIEAIHRGLQMIVNALQHYAKTKYPVVEQEEDSTAQQ